MNIWIFLNKLRERFSSKSNRRPATKEDLDQIVERILMKADELAQSLNDLNTQLGKVNTEIQGKPSALEEQIKNADVPQNVTDALAALKTSAQALDDITPDAPATSPT